MNYVADATCEIRSEKISVTKSFWRSLLVLPLFATMAMAAEPEPVVFAKAPTATKAGDSTTITFAVDRG